MNPTILASLRADELSLGKKPQGKKVRGTNPADKAGIGITTHKVISGEAGEPKLVATNSANRGGCKKQTVSHEQYDYE